MTGSDSSDIYYVYLHRKQTTGEIFYVGKGKDDRAYKLIGRNRWWKNIVKKHGYTVEFVCKGIPEEQAVLEEKRLIAEYGRLDLGTGCLCNLTDGGEGSSGARVSEESRRKRSASLKGKNRWARSEATKQKLRKANLGKKLSEETRRKISEANKGVPRPRKTPAKAFYVSKNKYIFTSIKVDDKEQYIGSFASVEEAKEVYNWCKEQLEKYGQVDVSRFRKRKKNAIIIKRRA